MVGMEKTDQPPPGDAVFTADLAAMMGVKPGTVKHYVSQARKGWPNGRSRPGFPDPDGRSLIDVASPSTPGSRRGGRGCRGGTGRRRRRS